MVLEAWISPLQGYSVVITQAFTTPFSQWISKQRKKFRIPKPGNRTASKPVLELQKVYLNQGTTVSFSIDTAVRITHLTARM
jgi:hypothetical protein